MVQILALLCGAYALIKGEVQFSSTRSVRGTHAQVAGGLLLLAGLIGFLGPDFIFFALASLVAGLVYAAVKAEENPPSAKR